MFLFSLFLLCIVCFAWAQVIIFSFFCNNRGKQIHKKLDTT